MLLAIAEFAMSPLVFKICTIDDWAIADMMGVFSGSEADLADGFIHLSSAGTIEATAAKERRIAKKEAEIRKTAARKKAQGKKGGETGIKRMLQVGNKKNKDEEEYRARKARKKENEEAEEAKDA